MEFEKPSLHNKNLVKYLRVYMDEWNMSQPALAEDIGVSSIQKWMRGLWPNAKSCEKLFDYFGVDFTEKFVYYTRDGKLMFEGSHQTFLDYLNIKHQWYLALVRDGKVIRKELPVADGECADYKTYDVTPESFTANHSRVFEAYVDDELVIRGNAKEVSKKFNLSPITMSHYMHMTKIGERKPHEVKFYHVGYDFKKNLEVAE